MTTRERPARQAVILVVDDEPDIGAYVKATLAESTYQVVWCGDVAAAVRGVEENRPDLALVDITLGGTETGWDVLQHLRASRDTDRIPTVMLTGSSDTVDREKSLRMGADRYLIKPVKPETLRRVVSEMLAARDDIWWSMTLHSDQVRRLRELFYDATTEVATLAVIVDDLRRQIENGETLQVFCRARRPDPRQRRDHRHESLRRE